MPPRILVVDDERNICELIQLALKAKGYEVLYATTGVGGVDLFSRFQPDLAIVDMTMPDIDGVESARQMKQTAHGSRTPIILMTGRGISEQDLDRSLFVGVLEKPFNIATLASIVQQFLNKT